jgi:hypothetical protein
MSLRVERSSAMQQPMRSSTRGRAANIDAMAAVQNMLEAKGIEFLVGDAPGVRLHPKKRA